MIPETRIFLGLMWDFTRAFLAGYPSWCHWWLILV